MTSVYFYKQLFRQRDQDSRVHLQAQPQLFFRDEPGFAGTSGYCASMLMFTCGGAWGFQERLQRFPVHASDLEPIPVDEYIPCWRPSEAGTALFVVAWLATRPPHALSALLMRCQQKTLPTGIGSYTHPFKGVH
ncbi:hypothetical protein [Janthinobacterium sp. 78]|uniref:hypothetical protein n=1 Tax=Janthinobacterium sp. 78 TaxID=2135631 RepID=UPI001057BA64|nr:hypothetical protein [Janthinobacterium sp. 78]